MAHPVEQIQNFTQTTRFYGIGLVLALVVLVYAVHRIRAWYRDGDDPADEQDEFVRQFQESKSRGDLTDEEFRSIRSRILSHEDQPQKPDTVRSPEK